MQRPAVEPQHNRNRHNQTSKTPLESQAQGTSLFTGACHAKMRLVDSFQMQFSQ